MNFSSKIFKLRGIGVALKFKIFLRIEFSSNFARCNTPNFCISSMITKPKFGISENNNA